MKSHRHFIRLAILVLGSGEERGDEALRDSPKPRRIFEFYEFERL